jgi:hypothetical protein
MAIKAARLLAKDMIFTWALLGSLPSQAPQESGRPTIA